MLPRVATEQNMYTNIILYSQIIMGLYLIFETCYITL